MTSWSKDASAPDLVRTKGSVRWPGIAGAKIRAGTLSSQHYSDMGDSLLLDFSRGFFAVADSSSRSPHTSHTFLRRIRKVLEAFPIFDPDRIDSPERLEVLKRELNRRAEALLHLVPFNESCTFTGLLMVKTEAGRKGVLLHTGDSLLFQVLPSIRRVQQETENNFRMVGRTRKYAQVAEIDILPEAVLILATDGFCDLDFPTYAARNEFVIQLASQHPIEDLPERFLKNIDGRGTPVDDFGVITLRPDRLRQIDSRILI